MNSKERPLSPHIQIYQPQMTSGLSILHRISGAALAVGLIMVVWLLVAAAYGEQAYNNYMSFAAGPIGQIFLMGWSAALFYHMANGVRHLFWDTGRLFKLKDARLAGMLVLLFAAGATALLWGKFVWQIV